MTLSTIPGIRFVDSTSRCYEYALDFVVAVAALGKYIGAYHNQVVTSFAPDLSSGSPRYPTMQFAAKASGQNLELFPHEVLTNVLVNDRRAGAIAYLSGSKFQAIAGNSTGAVAETMECFAHPMFTRYYENNLHGMEAAHGKRSAHNWPAVLQFASVIRDAMSHGDTVHMFSHVPAVQHFGLTYSHVDNGRKVVHKDLSCADLWFLMLEVDAVF